MSTPRQFESRSVKKIIDTIAVLLALIVLSPVFVFVAALALLIQGGPVLFRQERPGLRGHLFTLYKFRTMRPGAGSPGRPLPDSQYLTTLGRFLRDTSLDELPQLFNVIKGDMSLVGPRPLLVEYLPRYTREQARRHEVLPGITGWAQINGRNALSWEDKLALDTWYVDNRSLWLDLRILLRTFVCLVRAGRGAGTVRGPAPTPAFDDGLVLADSSPEVAN